MANYDDDGAVFDDLSLMLTANFIDYEDYPTSGNLMVEVRNDRGRIQLPRGRRGLPGQPGEAAKPFDGIKSIPTAENLPADPTEGQKSTAYVAQDTGIMWAWDAELASPEFREVGLFRGERGPRGDTVQIVAGSITTTAPGSSPTQGFTEISDGVYRWDVTLPRGVEGPEGPVGPRGPAASVEEAADVEYDRPPEPGDVLVYGDSAKWSPSPFFREIGPYSPKSEDWRSGQGQWTSATQSVIATVDIPGLPWKWRPKVFGNVQMGSGLGTRVQCEVRLGSDSGIIVGVGPGRVNDNDQQCTISPRFGADIHPNSDSAVVEAGAPVTLYLMRRRVSGGLLTAWFDYQSHLNVWCVPVDLGGSV
ncbi:hypothetical protein [Tomitella gaofuii]|uniref:hypothetical protein n=1 Tax=Tomitella gaofuii TaxID=2760083 RepID=UPI0015FA612A|nr:hypothetical protein [Tomitella gaofuii]